MIKAKLSIIVAIIVVALNSVSCCRSLTTRRSLSMKFNFNFNFLNPSNSVLSKKAKPVVVPPKDFTIPTPKPLSVADGDYLGVLSGAIALALRLGTGIFAVGWTPFGLKSDEESGGWPGTLGIVRDGSTVIANCPRPVKPLIVYEYEASPFCRKVREACSMLDLVVEYRPCPGARLGWSDAMAQVTGGRRTVPFLVDPNNNAGGSSSNNNNNKVHTKTTSMFESDDIIEYLFETYGPGKSSIPWTLKGDFAVKSSILAAQVRGFAGSKPFTGGLRSDLTSLEPIILWGYEGSPFVRPVRETLSSLGLAHVMVNCPRGSQNRDKLFRKTGSFQVPYIEDPNTGLALFESSYIVKYLKGTYIPSPPSSTSS